VWLKKHEHMRVASHLPPRPIPRVPFPPRLPCVRIWARRGARGGATGKAQDLCMSSTGWIIPFASPVHIAPSCLSTLMTWPRLKPSSGRPWESVPPAWSHSAIAVDAIVGKSRRRSSAANSRRMSAKILLQVFLLFNRRSRSCAHRHGHRRRAPSTWLAFRWGFLCLARAKNAQPGHIFARTPFPPFKNRLSLRDGSSLIKRCRASAGVLSVPARSRAASQSDDTVLSLQTRE